MREPKPVLCRWWHIAVPLAIIGMTIVGLWVDAITPSRAQRYLNMLGSSAHKALDALGQADAVLHTRAELLQPPFSEYRRSTREPEGPILVYLREGEMIALYMGADGAVASIYFGQKLDTPRRVTGRRGGT